MTPNTRLTPDEMLAAVESCKALAMKFAKRFRASNPAIRLADLYETALHGLRLAALKFDPSRGNKFVTVAYRYVWTELIGFCRLESARGMHVPEDHEPYFAMVNSGFGEPWQHPPAKETDEAEPDFWKLVGRTLDRRSVTALARYYRDGVLQKVIAIEMNLSYQRVGQLIQQAVIKLRGRADLAELAGVSRADVKGMRPATRTRRRVRKRASVCVARAA